MIECVAVAGMAMVGIAIVSLWVRFLEHVVGRCSYCKCKATSGRYYPLGDRLYRFCDAHALRDDQHPWQVWEW